MPIRSVGIMGARTCDVVGLILKRILHLLSLELVEAFISIWHDNVCIIITS